MADRCRRIGSLNDQWRAAALEVAGGDAALRANVEKLHGYLVAQFTPWLVPPNQGRSEQ